MEKRILDKLKQEELKILDYVVKICEDNNLEYFLIGGTLLGAVRHQGYIPWDDDLDIAMPRKDYEKFIKIFLNLDNSKYTLESGENSKVYWLPFLKVRNKNTIYQESVLKNYQGELGIWLDIFPLDNADKEVSKIQSFQFRYVKNSRYAISLKSKVIVPPKSRIKTLLFRIISLLPMKLLRFIQRKVMTINKNSNSKYVINLGSQYGMFKQTHLRDKYYPIKKLMFEGRSLNVPNNYDYILKKIYGHNYMILPPIEKRITHNPIFIKFEDGEELKFDEKI